MADFNEKLEKLMANLDKTQTKNEIQKMLQMLNEGKTEEIMKSLGKKDKAKIDQMMKKIDKKKLEAFGLNLRELQDQVDPDTINQLGGKVCDIDPNFSKKLKDLLE